MREITRDQLERVSRIYKTNKDAYKALGISPGMYAQLCRQYRIETPLERRRRCAADREAA